MSCCSTGVIEFLLGLKSLSNFSGHPWQCYFEQCAATQECHSADTGHDAPPLHSIQTHCRPVIVLFIDVERHTGIQNASFYSLGSDPIGYSFPDLPHTLECSTFKCWYCSCQSEAR